ncbi:MULTISPECIES: HAD family hydrolase [Streptococcus]|uniref:HAD family hydrolase n=1 Tax=Streptococcus TaxID=1301 RepID=UPI000489FF7A|nr:MULTISPECIES: HAD family phosphatase [Streptococcus]
MMSSKIQVQEKSLVIFDMDGLFFDSEKIYAEGWRKGFKTFDISVSDEFIYSMAGQSAHDNNLAMGKFLDEATLQAVRKIREDYFYQKLAEDKVPTSYFAVEMGSLLKKDGYQIALASSSNNQRVYELLNSKELCCFFNYVVTGDQVEFLKPAPDVYKKVLSLAGKFPEDALAFEDSLTGAKAAQNAGVDVCLVSKELSQTLPDSEKYQGVFPNLKAAYKSIFK